MAGDKHARNIIIFMVLITLFSGIIALTGKEEAPQFTKVKSTKKESKPSGLEAEVKEGIHLPTGFIADVNFELVVTNCTGCHAADLVTQNRMTKQGWEDIIVWMQEKQNLWDLGPNKEKIVAYLAKNYAPKDEGRRKQLKLKPDDWYVLEN
jgi:hypothetical protein